jgi:tetratricopeptide (TPR) repeat protein
MPARTYMVIDPRRDHSLRVPRPDLSVSLGVPNPCNDCHADQTSAWAADQVRGWLGRDARGFQQFAEAFHAADEGRAAAMEALRQVAADRSQPAIARASAVGRLAIGAVTPPTGAIEAGLQDPHPGVRRAALSALGVFPPQVQVALAAPLLEDLARAVRIEAAWQLAPLASAFSSRPDTGAFGRAVDEFVSAQRLLADRAEARATLGEFFGRLGRTAEAIDEYRAAVRLGPLFPPAYVGLAELYRRDGSEEESQQTLQAGLERLPEAAGLHHALGLSLARSRRVEEAVAALGRAATLAPEEPRFAYAHAVGLHSSGRVDEAIRVLDDARQRHPADRDILFALATFHRDAGRRDAAILTASRLLDLHPADANARALLDSLTASAR